MTARRRLTMLQRLKIFEAHGGNCHICDRKIEAGEAWDLDHVRALALGGEDEPENLAPVHRSCHRGAGSKSSDDTARVAKAKRQKAKHYGLGKSKRGFRKAEPQRTATRPIEKWRAWE